MSESENRVCHYLYSRRVRYQAARMVATAAVKVDRLLPLWIEGGGARIHEAANLKDVSGGASRQPFLSTTFSDAATILALSS